MRTKKTQEEPKQEQKEATPKKSPVTYLGPGPLTGEYRFKEIAGSIAAESEEAAIQKAEEIAVKHPDLLIK